MKRKNAARNALFTSVLSLLLCVSMLVGTTFAWFTDTESTGINTIQSGNLDLEVYYAYPSDVDANGDIPEGKWKPVEANTPVFNKDALWEPGYTEVVFFKFDNAGSLSFQYQLQVDIVNEVLGKTEDGADIQLSNYINAYACNTFSNNYKDFLFTDREDATNPAGAPNPYFDTLYNAANGAVATPDGQNPLSLDSWQWLEPDETTYATMVLWMPTTVGNEANHDGEHQPKIDLGISVLATQYNWEQEEDSFDHNYDKDALFPVSVNTAADLIAALAAGEKAILTGDVTLEENAEIPAGVASVIDLNGYSLTLGKGGIAVKGSLNVTGGNVNVEDGADDLDAAFTVGNGGELNVEPDAAINVTAPGTAGVIMEGGELNVDGAINVDGGEYGVFAFYANADINVAGSINATTGTAITQQGGTTNVVVDENAIAGEIMLGASGTMNLTYAGVTQPTVNTDGTAVTLNAKQVVSNDQQLADAIKNAPTTGKTVIVLADGTYSDDINLTVAELGAREGDLVIKAAAGAKPVIAGTVTLGYRIQGTGATMFNTNVTFEGITFDHANAATHSIDVQDVKSLTLKDCTIIGDGEYGMTSARGNATGSSKIVGCTFENAGMQLLGNFATGLVIDGCTFNNSCINVQAGNGVTVQNCKFDNTLTDANLGDNSFYVIRSNSTPITVSDCQIKIDSTITGVAAGQEKWGILWNRGTTNWTVEDVAITLTDAALAQTELDVLKCTSTGKINTTNLTVNGAVYANSTNALKDAVASGDDVEITLAPGNYTVPTNLTAGQEVTIVGGKDTVFNITNLVYPSGTNAVKMNFEGVTINGTGYTNGLAYTNATYTNCTFNTADMYLYRSSKFINCTFNDRGTYALWTWGAGTVEFEGCTFNTSGKALYVNANVLDNGTNHQTVKITGCKFYDTGANDIRKAAIETGDDYNRLSYDIYITETTVEGFAVTEDKTSVFNYGGTNFGTNVWGNKYLMGTDKLNVVIDGVDVH